MTMNRIAGPDALFISGVSAIGRSSQIKQNSITHILSVLDYDLGKLKDAETYRHISHLCIDVNDMPDEDMLLHFPRIVRFVHQGLCGSAEIGASLGSAPDSRTESATPAPAAATAAGPDMADSSSLPSSPPPPPPPAGASPPRPPPPGAQPGSVLVHCAMGRSRSATAVIAYLMWRYPHRFGRSDPATTGEQAAARALAWVRETRPMAEPNVGFMRQLAMWWDMGCPCEDAGLEEGEQDSGDDSNMTRHPAYQRWRYECEVLSSARLGRAPNHLRFEDEEASAGGGADGDKRHNMSASLRPGETTAVAGHDATKNGAADQQQDAESARLELRCKKCRRVLATQPFVVPHQGNEQRERELCPHVFIQPLSWMRPELERGALEGRLACPGPRCAASIGRYTWRGFRCGCDEWVLPAFALQKSKVDQMRAFPAGARTGPGAVTDRMRALGIRMPPDASRGAA